MQCRQDQHARETFSRLPRSLYARKQRIWRANSLTVSSATLQCCGCLLSLLMMQSPWRRRLISQATEQLRTRNDIDQFGEAVLIGEAWDSLPTIEVSVLRSIFTASLSNCFQPANWGLKPRALECYISLAPWENVTPAERGTLPERPSSYPTYHVNVIKIKGQKIRISNSISGYLTWAGYFTYLGYPTSL